MAARRFSLYFSWDRGAENRHELGVLEDRFPTLFEFRRSIWPHYEHAAAAVQDITGFLDHVILFDFEHFQDLIEGFTGRKVALVQRSSDALAPARLVGPQPTTRRLIDDDLLEATDTLIVVSLDHVLTAQSPEDSEIRAIRRFAARPDAWLIICPHHDIGTTGEDLASREREFRHHGDGLVPAVQRFGGYARSLLEAIGVPVVNRFGLSPAAGADGGPAPLLVEPQAGPDVLRDVSTFNLHPHLPHLQILPGAVGNLRVLARQPINTSAKPHPFSQDHTHFDALVWAPPAGDRACNVLVCDATLWSAAFGGLRSLEAFWRNLAEMPTDRARVRARPGATRL